MPALRVDWQSIKGAVVDTAAPYVFILPNGGRHLLLAIADMLQWEATFRAYGYDYADWDTLQAVQSDAVSGLLGGVPLADLIEHIDEIEPLLREIRDRPCCEDETFLFDQTSEPGNVIQHEQDDTGADVVVSQGDDPPGDHADWPTYQDHLCDAATKFAQGLPELMDILATVSGLTQIGLALAATFFLAAFAGLGLVGAAVAGALSTTLSLTFLDNLRTLVGQDEPFSTEKAELEVASLQEKIVCAFMDHPTPEGAYNAIIGLLDTYAPNASPFVQWFPIRYAINKIYNAESDSAGGFGGGCTSCPPPCYVQCGDYTCYDAVLTATKQQESCTNYQIDSFTQVSSDTWELVWSVSGTHCSIVRVNLGVSMPTAPAGNRAHILEFVEAERLSGTAPLTFSGIGDLLTAEGGERVFMSQASLWRTCIASEANAIDLSGSVYGVSSSRDFGAASFRVRFRIVQAMVENP